MNYWGKDFLISVIINRDNYLFKNKSKFNIVQNGVCITIDVNFVIFFLLVLTIIINKVHDYGLD